MALSPVRCLKVDVTVFSCIFKIPGFLELEAYKKHKMGFVVMID